MQIELAISLAALTHWRTITYGLRASEMANLSNLWGGVDKLAISLMPPSRFSYT
jgi:hypothetical protein